MLAIDKPRPAESVSPMLRRYTAYRRLVEPAVVLKQKELSESTPEAAKTVKPHPALHLGEGQNHSPEQGRKYSKKRTRS
jgi:hypothetical protein